MALFSIQNRQQDVMGGVHPLTRHHKQCVQIRAVSFESRKVCLMSLMLLQVTLEVSDGDDSTSSPIVLPPLPSDSGGASSWVVVQRTVRYGPISSIATCLVAFVSCSRI